MNFGLSAFIFGDLFAQSWRFVRKIHKKFEYYKIIRNGNLKVFESMEIYAAVLFISARTGFIKVLRLSP
jgi:hypothetical protein